MLMRVARSPGGDTRRLTPITAMANSTSFLRSLRLATPTLWPAAISTAMVISFVLSGTQLKIMDHEGQVLAATDSDAAHTNFHGMVLGDVNGDGLQEICTWSRRTNGVAQNVVHLLDLDLQPLAGWPTILDPYDSLHFGLALADLDGDDDLEVIATHQDSIHVWDEPNPGTLPPTTEWPMFGHDPSLGSYYHKGQGAPPPRFTRGDANRDTRIDVADAVTILQTITGELLESSCPAAFDVNRDLALDFADAIDLLTHAYLDGPPPSDPYPTCNRSSFDEELECTTLWCP